MPPALAISLCFGFIAFAYWVDIRRNPNVSTGLWIPLIWVLIIGSRPVSMWISPGGELQSSEGSPLDAAIYSILIIAACITLSKRQISLREIFARNGALIALFAYMVASTLWTEDPFVSFKRFIKMIGMPCMALMVLTEEDPVIALATLARRSAYFLLLLSETLNKYFFNLAVQFDAWTGAMAVSGASSSKNMLGQVCFIEALLLIWLLISRIGREEPYLRKTQLALDLLIAYLAIYLLYRSNSSTSVACLIVGVVVLFAGNLRFIRWRIATFLFIAVLLFLSLQSVIGVYDPLVRALHRDPTLTDRTEIWHELWALRGNLLIGTGFEGFWTGERLMSILRTRNIQEAHNGYLEIILNLGLVGLTLWLSFIVAAYRTAKRFIATDYVFGRIGLTIFAVMLVYNLTESGIKGLSSILFFFFVFGIDASAVQQMAPTEEFEEAINPELLPESIRN
jgi:exopolysaccharide production protein ExoQ